MNQAIDNARPNLAAIRELLLAAYTAKTLRRFCNDLRLCAPRLPTGAAIKGWVT